MKTLTNNILHFILFFLNKEFDNYVNFGNKIIYILLFNKTWYDKILTDNVNIGGFR